MLNFSRTMTFFHFIFFLLHSSNSFWFSLGISDVGEAYLAAIKSAIADSHEVHPQTSSVEEKANSFSKHLHNDQTMALGKIQDGLQYLSYLVITNSMPAA